MRHMLFIFLQWTLCVKLVRGLVVPYEELRKLNISCYPEDTCIEPRTEDSPGISLPYSCSCSRLCSQFNTCCTDSYYNSVRPPKLRPSCRKVKLTHGKTAYFMVDRCSSDDHGDSIFERLCNDEWSAKDDLMRLVPVTSLFSSMTYRNYFCLRCHETTHEYFYWNVWLKGRSSFDVQLTSDSKLIYNDIDQAWMLAYDQKAIKVNLRFEVPFEIWSLPVGCELDLISHCSDQWTDLPIKDKCSSYTAVVAIKKDTKVLKYRNVHCALCNFEPLEEVECKSHFQRHLDTDYDGDLESDEVDERGNAIDGDLSVGRNDTHVYQDNFAKEFHSGGVRKKLFSFTHLLDINPTGGDKVGKLQVCEKNFIWDPYAEECRILVCAFPGFIVKEKKCVPK